MHLGNRIRIRVGDIVNIKHGFAFKGEYFSDEPTENILITPGNFKIGGGFKDDKLKFYNGPVPEEYILKPNDIIVTMTDLSKNGDTLGFTAIVPKMSGTRLLHNQRIGLLEHKSDLVDKMYLYWVMRSTPYQKYIVNSCSGSTVKHTAPSRIYEYEYDYPDINTQRKIVQILSALDEKVELNRQTNATLEAIAQAIFKEWFVDFNYPGATGELVESELGPIPKGWNVKPLDKIADFLNGLALQKFPLEIETEYLPVIKIRELRTGVTDSSDRASRNLPSDYIIQDGDLIFSWSGSLEVVFWIGGEGALNQHLFKVTSKKYPLWFCYYWILSHLRDFRNIAEEKTTTMGHIKREHLSNALCLIPDNLDILDRLVQPIYTRMIENDKECQLLNQTRDLLLPRLMNGEIEL